MFPMNIKPIIRTKADYRAALKEIESLMSARANTPEGERLDVLFRGGAFPEHSYAEKTATAKLRIGDCPVLTGPK